MTPTITTNAYWDAVKDHVNPTGSLWRTPEVGGIPADRDFDRWVRETPQRRDLVRRYSWTITDPATVAFVAEHAHGRLLDPMAGTGWWGHLLAQHGVDVVCSDVDPGGNEWHNGQPLWVPVATADAVGAVAAHPDRVLFLSWPPYNQPAGVDTVRAYPGARVIAIHEGEGGCVGDDDLFAELATNWVEVAEHIPVQWFGMHDRVVAYDRKNP